VKPPAKDALSSVVVSYLDTLNARGRADEEARHFYDVLLGGLPGLQGAKQFIIVRDGQLHLDPAIRLC
jgi:hypothetical protein